MRKNGESQTISNLAIGMVQFLLLAAPVTAQIPCEYDVQIIASPLDCGLGTVNTFGLGLNEHGDVVGYYRCPLWNHTEAFLWTAEGGFVTLQRPQGVSSVNALDINDDGVICGTLMMSGLGSRGFVYEKGEWTIIEPVVPDSGGWSSAAAINNAGTVVGQRSITEKLGPQNAYIWSAEKGFTDLGVMNGPNSGATSVSENGLVAGWTGTGILNETFLWQRGEITILGSVPDGITSIPSAITDGSVIVGWGHIPKDGFPFGFAQAFRWASQEYQMLGTLPDHLHSASLDSSIKTELIVGVSWVVEGVPNVSHGFIWDEGFMTNLDDLLPSLSGVSTRSAAAITNTGQIIADGTDSENNAVVLLLTPIEPPPGDLDGDCAVGVSDLLMLLANWGPCKNCDDCRADLDGDCSVGVKDLLILLGNWG
ncbi:MAG: hypothetical protein IIB53_16770 [Planctomycetes bacterium]|nr:hypothetical protein [Planctomycetota bacterium]